MINQRKNNRYYKDTFIHGGSTLVKMKKHKHYNTGLLPRILVTNKQ